MTLPPGNSREAERRITGRYLLLKGAGHQPPQLGQAVVDAIAPSLLDDLGQKAEGQGRAAGTEG